MIIGFSKFGILETFINLVNLDILISEKNSTAMINFTRLLKMFIHQKYAKFQKYQLNR
jgi:hypothetical protein